MNFERYLKYLTMSKRILCVIFHVEIPEFLYYYYHIKNA